jgi:penicillin V acylase-like amidase (Ntn superfamily)
LDTIEAFPAIIKTDTKTGYKTVGIANLSVAGWKENNLLSKSTVISSPYFTFDGMNQYGLAVCALSVPFGSSSAIDSSKTTLHDLTVDRVIMDKTKNVKEAIDLLSQYNVKMEERYPTHYMIADSEGNSAIVEYINGSMKIIENEEDYQIATNFILYDNENLKGYSSERYAEFEKSLSQASGILSMEAALELLEENVVPGEAQWSVVYNLTKRTMAVEFYGDYDKTYYYDINE